MGNNYNLGYTACYINDHPFKHQADLPVEVAVAWVKAVTPESQMGNGVLAKDLTTKGHRRTNAGENGWLNKLFIVVGSERGKAIAIYSHDGKFSMRVEE